MKRVIVSALSAWAPGVCGPKQWREWAMKKRQIEVSTASPDLTDFTDSLFRRRLSQISRMTIRVVHDTVEAYKECKSEDTTQIPIVFISMRGEIHRELSISQMIVSEGEVSPASFSLSVFNAPIATASIALGLHGGYTAVYPSGGNFSAAFTAAQAMLYARQSVLVAYADEAVPEEYDALPDAVRADGKRIEPMAFACVITPAEDNTTDNTNDIDNAISTSIKTADVPHEASDFLKGVIINSKGWGA